MDDVVDYYSGLTGFTENDRLRGGLGMIELARTQEIVQRSIPAPPARVLDVGSGPGVYSAWLAALGYEVHLIDVTPRHVEQARELSARQPDRPIASCEVGDARRLSAFDDGSVDAVLLLGPLYHLTERADRLDALREARRVLRPGGTLIGAAISRFASLLDGLDQGFLDDPVFADIVDRDLEDGQHRNPSEEHPEWFMTTFFHHPDELRREVIEAGFPEPELLAIEGPAWAARDLDQRWEDKQRRVQLMDLLRRVEREPSLMGCSPHIAVVGRKGAETPQ